MHDKDYLLSLLDYTVWANEEYFKQIRDLPPGEVTKQRPSLMNNILISVNHMLVIEKVWLSHMKGGKHSFDKLQTILHENLDDLMAAKKEMDVETRSYVSNLSEDELEEVVDYELIGGNKGSLPRYLIITHLAMHGAFHRGFIGDMFGQIPVLPGGQDIPVWERALRQG
ncbi:MAG: hypothetical protein COC02_00490 [Rhodospirillaceae bacterium]|jgi:uncharacterized damage-inducible protein DinB|nr:MAG: hypothetical protein COC02_00490 [Rhodospirillaceae bacterium]PPR72835.1 MAG: hypothetical protein CFH03_01212 [Alphaproteobacteria bacterium MarineAlpha3_Bin2]